MALNENDILAKYGVSTEDKSSKKDDDLNESSILKKYGVTPNETKPPKPTNRSFGDLNLSEKVDSVFAAPARKLVGDIQQKKGLLQIINDTVDQIGNDPNNAPTAKEINKNLGIPENVSLKQFLSNAQNPAFKLGGLLMSKDNPVGKLDAPELATNAVLDFSNLLPVGKLGKGAEVGLEGLSKLSKATNLSENLEKTYAKVAPLLENKLARSVLAGSIGYKAHGPEGAIAAALASTPEGVNLIKESIKGLLGLGKNANQAELINKSLNYIPPKAANIAPAAIEGLLREEIARSRTEKE